MPSKYTFIEQKLSHPPWFQRWHVYVATLLIGFSMGQSAVFNLYTSQLKGLGYTTDEVLWLAFAANVGYFFAVPIGGMYDKVGAMYSIIFSSLCTGGGFTLIWAVLRGSLDVSYTTMWWFHFIAYGGSYGFEPAIGLTSQKNFPLNRGYVLSLGSATTSIGSTFLSEYSKLEDVSSLILFMGILPMVAGLLLWPFIRTYTDVAYSTAELKASNNTLMFFVAGYSIIITYLTAITIAETQESFNNFAYGWVIAIYCALIASVLYGGLIFHSYSLEKERHNVGQLLGYDAKDAAQPEETDVFLPRDPDDTKPADGKSESYTTFPRARRTTDWHDYDTQRYLAQVKAYYTDFRMWLLAAMIAFSFGGFLVIGTNIIQIAMAVTGLSNADDIENYTSSLTISVAFGRLSGGILADEMFRRYNVHRVCFLGVASALMTVGLITIADSDEETLYLGITLCGVAFGISNPVQLLFVYDVWGEALFGIGVLSSVVPMTIFGSYVGSIVLYSNEYDDEAQLNMDGTAYCFGNKCFDDTMYILGLFGGIGMLLCVLLWWATSDLYTKGKPRKPIQLELPKGDT